MARRAARGVDLRQLSISPKQAWYIAESDAFVNLAEGAVRSGKTASGLLRWLAFVATAPSGGDLVVSAKRTTLRCGTSSTRSATPP